MNKKHKRIELPKETDMIAEEGKILVKEFIQGLILGFLAGVLMCWFALG